MFAGLAHSATEIGQIIYVGCLAELSCGEFEADNEIFDSNLNPHKRVLPSNN